MKKLYLSAGVLVLIAAVFIRSQIFNRPKTEQTPAPTFSENTARESGLETQTNMKGLVTVTITPKNLSEREWNFEVVLDTHSEELIADLAKTAALVDESGKEHPPLGWEGSPAGGHHREGVLKFEPLLPTPKKIELVLSGIGGISERKFLWTPLEVRR